jgi:uncharacterized protein DUF4440
MNKRLRLGGLIASIVLLSVAFLFGASNDEEGVRKVISDQSKAWNEHNMDAFANLFTTDADYINPVGRHTKGREAIRITHAFLHGTIPVDTPGVQVPRAMYGRFKSTTSRNKEVEVRFLRKDIAVAHVMWEMIGDAEANHLRRGIFTLVLDRQGGTWLVAAAQDTEIPSKP